MDAKVQARMDVAASVAYRQAMNSLAIGWCEDEGKRAGEDGTQEERPASVKYDPEAVLWLVKNPAGAFDQAQHEAIINFLGACSNKERLAFAAKALLRTNIPGVVKWAPEINVRDMDTAEFMAAFRAGAHRISVEEGMSLRRGEIEWFWRQAEAETGIKRRTKDSETLAQSPLQRILKLAQRRLYMRAYGNS